MKSHVNRQFLGEVEKAFAARYPFLKVEFAPAVTRGLALEDEGIDGDRWLRQADDLLVHEVGITDGMTVREFETRLREVLGVQGVVLRRSGNFWIETSMTQKWTLKEQDAHGKDLASGVQ